MAFKLYFVKSERGKGIKKRKTPEWILRKDSDRSLGEILGRVRFCGRWHQFVFESEDKSDWKGEGNIVWSAGCLRVIADFLDKTNMRWRKIWARRRKMPCAYIEKALPLTPENLRKICED